MKLMDCWCMRRTHFSTSRHGEHSCLLLILFKFGFPEISLPGFFFLARLAGEALNVELPLMSFRQRARPRSRPSRMIILSGY